MTPLPRITIVTPSFNQAPFLEATIRSVLDQGYPNLQYGVIDGGSTDGSAAIIERYRDRLDFAVIEPDGGQAEAINKGLKRADGDIVGWLCSDDVLMTGSLHAVGGAAARGAAWIAGACRVLGPDGTPRHLVRPAGDFSLAGVLLRGGDRPFELPQPSVFWAARLHRELGLLREDLHYCMDFEWWLRLLHAGHRPTLVDAELSGYRLHEQSKTVGAPEGFLREHVAVEGAYARSVGWRDRLRVQRRIGYLRRAVAVRTHRGSLWPMVACRPWWLASQQVREALRTRRAAA